MSRPARKPVPAREVLKVVETPHDRFIRLANQRCKPIIKYLRMLGRLGAPGYERTSEEIDKLESILRSELDRALTRLRGTPEESEIGNVL